MARVFGTNWTRAALLERVGDISQIGGVRCGQLEDGFERGVRTLDFRTGSGFDFMVLPDRGMDIGQAVFRGAPLTWRSATTHIGPAFYEPEGTGWLRGFAGGLLAVCGLTSYGPPGMDGDQALGLHGRASYTPATHVAHGGEWQGDEYEMYATGQLREAAVFGENLLLRRRIAARLGESRLCIEDVVTNEGYKATPLMLMYHCNFGFPLVSEDAELLVNSTVAPRDEQAAQGLADCRRFQSPTRDYRPQVFFHSLAAGPEGAAQAALVNRRFAQGAGLGVFLRYRLDELPCLAQWKMMGQGTYVCGLEPGTNWLKGRAKERAEGRLRFLEPGETRRFRLEIGVLASLAEIDAIARSIRG